MQHADDAAIADRLRTHLAAVSADSAEVPCRDHVAIADEEGKP